VEVREAESKLQANWNDLQAWDKINEAQQKLEEVRMDKLEGQKMKAGATWVHMGDKCTKEFFEFHKQIKPKTKIKEILDGGKSLRTLEEISSFIHQYYKQLYKKDPVCETNLQVRVNNLRNVPRVVTPVQNGELTRPFTQKEMEDAVKDLVGGKALGLDRIPTEVYKTLWPNIGQEIQKQLEEALEKKSLHPQINGGLQSLIPKGGSKTQISNYRPISVLPSMYKVMAKTMANQMQNKLPLWIKIQDIPNRIYKGHIHIGQRLFGI
jgi:hypothetical protein